MDGTNGLIGGGSNPVWGRWMGQNAIRCLSLGGLGWIVCIRRQRSAGGVGVEFSAVAGLGRESGIHLYGWRDGAAAGGAGKPGEWRWGAAAGFADAGGTVCQHAVCHS